MNRNEIILTCNYNTFLNILKKFKAKMEYENYDFKIPLVKEIDSEIKFSDIEFERAGPVFYWCGINNRLIIHYSIEHPSEQIYFNTIFFEELKKHTDNDFKISIWDMESRKMIYVGFINK